MLSRDHNWVSSADPQDFSGLYERYCQNNIFPKSPENDLKIGIYVLMARLETNIFT